MWINTEDTMFELSCTELHHYDMIFCNALVHFLYIQKNQLTCHQIVLLTCWQDSLADIFWWHVSQTFTNMLPTCRHVLVTCHLGGLGDMTRCRNFQLGLTYHGSLRVLPVIDVARISPGSTKNDVFLWSQLSILWVLRAVLWCMLWCP